jgi:hypothetical protein
MHEVTIVVIDDGETIDNSEGNYVYQQTVLRRVGKALHVYLKQNVQSVLEQIPDEEMTQESKAAWEQIQEQMEN